MLVEKRSVRDQDNGKSEPLLVGGLPLIGHLFGTVTWGESVDPMGKRTATMTYGGLNDPINVDFKDYFRKERPTQPTDINKDDDDESYEETYDDDFKDLIVSEEAQTLIGVW